MLSLPNFARARHHDFGGATRRLGEKGEATHRRDHALAHAPERCGGYSSTSSN